MVEFFKFATSSWSSFLGTSFLIILILGIPFGTISSAIVSWTESKAFAKTHSMEQ